MTETEKITINISAVDLGRIDLLVDEGFYSNRSDFIRSAIRKELDVHRDIVIQTVSRKTMVLGAVMYSRHDLELAQAKGVVYDIKVVGAVLLDCIYHARTGPGDHQPDKNLRGAARQPGSERCPGRADQSILREA